MSNCTAMCVVEQTSTSTDPTDKYRSSRSYKQYELRLTTGEVDRVKRAWNTFTVMGAQGRKVHFEVTTCAPTPAAWQCSLRSFLPHPSSATSPLSADRALLAVSVAHKFADDQTLIGQFLR